MGLKHISVEEREYQKKIDAAIKRYLKNDNLKAIGQKIPFTKEQAEEYLKCSEDAVYFVQKFVKIVNVDKGLIPIELYPKQKEMIETCQNNRFVCIKASRQVGKTTTVAVGYILWYILFHSDKRVGILANKEDTAIEILSRLRIAYMNLPMWMQQGVAEWAKTGFTLENGSSAKASSTSSAAIRGWSINVLYLDEFAHVPPSVADDFFSSVFPTISSGKTTQVIVTSTPFGMNLFYKLCKDAEKQYSDPTKWNGFVLREYDWRTVPWRLEDPTWESRERGALGETKFEQEHMCEFLGSQGTLISGKVLRALAYRSEIKLAAADKLKIYEEPKQGVTYLLVNDTSYGKELDYSAFIVYDISVQPYRMVAVYKCNDIPHQLYPDVIKATAMHYNNAWVFGENNDVGSQVLYILANDLEYEHILYTETKNSKTNLKNTGSDAGIRSTPKTKRQGCMALKSLIEGAQLIVDDFSCIEELSSFVAKPNKTYSADEGRHDDLVTCLWIFAWLTTQQYFKDFTDTDMRKKMFADRAAVVEQEMPPMPIVQMAMQPPSANQEVHGGCVWSDAELPNQIDNDHAFGGRWTGY